MEKTVLVFGVTGRQGGATAKHLLKSGWKVRGITRNPDKEKAKQAKASGVEMIKANLDDPETLKGAFSDVYGVFSVQNPWITGLKKEVEHGKRIVNMANDAGVKHLIYASAGTGKSDTNVPHFNSKVEIEEALKASGVPYTILRSVSFMELMRDKDFLPPLVMWSVMPKILGENHPIMWISADDVGAIAAAALKDPDKFTGKELSLGADLKSVKECKELYLKTYDKQPKRIPAPVWIFKKMQYDLHQMFLWMKSRSEPITVIEETTEIHPNALTVERWMKKMKEIDNPSPPPVRDF